MYLNVSVSHDVDDLIFWASAQNVQTQVKRPAPIAVAGLFLSVDLLGAWFYEGFFEHGARSSVG